MNLEDKAQLNYYPVEIESSTSSTEPSYNTSSEAVSDSNIQTTGGISIMSAGAFQSPNYVKGSSGWKIDVLGNVEFSNGYFRGDITGASGTFTGTVTATSGLIGGFSIGSDYIKDVADSFGLASTVTGGNDVRFWAGDTFANRATADLRIYEDGAIIASNIEATGSIFATSGWIGSATALVYESQGINTGTTGWIRGGQTGYNTGTGYFLGYSSGAYKFSIGDTTTGNSLLWDGSSLIVNGSQISNNDIFGDGSDGDVTISTDTTLTSDVYYNNLTVNNSVILNTGSYKLFVKNTLLNNGTISRAGNSGTSASGTTPGAGGTALADGTIGGSQAGKIGATGGSTSCGGVSDNPGTKGTDGSNQTNVIGNNGVGGGKGGTANGLAVGGAATAGGTVTLSTSKCRNAVEAVLLRGGSSGFNLIYSNASSGSGSSGAYTGDGGGGTINAGAGGGSGSGGGNMLISARFIINNGIITVKGGNGGNGSDATGGNTSGCYGAGGGGGGGGNGGLMVLIYSSLQNSGSLLYSGGSKGLKGTGVRNNAPYAPFAGDDGQDGASGTLIQMRV